MFSDLKRLVVAEYAVAECDFLTAEKRLFNANVGLFEFINMLINREMDIREFQEVVILLGRADMKKSRHFPKLLELFISTMRMCVPGGRFVIGGPFPDPRDTPQEYPRLQQVRHYVEERISAESDFAFCRSGERFFNSGGLNEHLMDQQGLTDLGNQVLRRDIVETLSVLARRWR